MNTLKDSISYMPRPKIVSAVNKNTADTDKNINKSVRVLRTVKARTDLLENLCKEERL